MDLRQISHTVGGVSVASADDIQILDRYMQAIGKEPLLGQEEEKELAQKVAQGDLKARDRMVMANLRLVVKIAYNYAGMGVPLIDLISEGNLGLIKAVERFKANRGGRLVTYAGWWIRQHVKSALAAQSKTISLPMHVVEKIAKMRSVRAKLTEELHRPPTTEEIAKAMRIGRQKVLQLKALTSSSTSLETAPPFALPLEETLQDSQVPSPLGALLQKTAKDHIHQILSNMDQREANIIRLRYGLDGSTPLTLDEIGKKMDLTRERIRQLEHSAHVYLRKVLARQEDTLSKSEIKEQKEKRARVDVLRQFMIEKGLLK